MWYKIDLSIEVNSLLMGKGQRLSNKYAFMSRRLSQIFRSPDSYRDPQKIDYQYFLFAKTYLPVGRFAVNQRKSARNLSFHTY